MSWPPAIGEILPHGYDAFGVESKLRAYSLNTEHAIGTHKARVFQRMLGITIADAEYLAAQLLAGLHTSPVSDIRDNTPYGILCEVSVPVRGIRECAGQTEPVTTSWEYRQPADAPRLVSAYIEA